MMLLIYSLVLSHLFLANAVTGMISYPCRNDIDCLATEICKDGYCFDTIQTPTFKWVSCPQFGYDACITVKFPSGGPDDVMLLQSKFDKKFCIYTGTMRNEPESRVAVTGGCPFSGQSLAISIYSTRLNQTQFQYIRSSAGYRTRKKPGYRVIISKNRNPPPIKLGPDVILVPERFKESQSQEPGVSAELLDPNGYVLDLYVLYDMKFLKAHRGNPKLARKKILEMVTHVQNRFEQKRSLGTSIKINLLGCHLIHAHHDFLADTDSLDRFGVYVKKSGIHAHLYQLLTTDFKGLSAPVGMSVMGSVCSSHPEVRVNIFEYIDDVHNTATGMAHQIGHSLGMHDDFYDGDVRWDNQDNKCTGVDGYMDFASYSDQWSPCSAQDIRDYVQSHERFCLKKRKDESVTNHALSNDYSGCQLDTDCKANEKCEQGSCINVSQETEVPKFKWIKCSQTKYAACMSVKFPDSGSDDELLLKFRFQKNLCIFSGHLRDEPDAPATVTGGCPFSKQSLTISVDSKRINQSHFLCTVLKNQGNGSISNDAASEISREDQNELRVEAVTDDSVPSRETVDFMEVPKELQEAVPEGPNVAMDIFDPNGYTLDLYMCYDSSFLQAHGDQESKAVKKLKELVAHTQNRLNQKRTLGALVKIKLVGYHLIHSRHNFHADGDNLNRFGALVNRSGLRAHVFHLITTDVNKASTATGIAYKGVVCNKHPKMRVGIVEYRENVQITATTLAHELGHNLGLSHDFNKNENRLDREGRVCTNKQGYMDYGLVRHNWSTCSAQDLKDHVQSHTRFCLPKLVRS